MTTARAVRKRAMYAHAEREKIFIVCRGKNIKTLDG